MAGSSRQLPEEAKKQVQNHINSFPNFESHYTRSHNPNKRYLHPDLTIRKMFNLYELHREENGIKAVNEWTYRKIFKKDFDLHFHQPLKDTCQKCDLLNIKIKASNNEEEKNKLTEEHDVHLRLAESARNSLKQAQELVSLWDETIASRGAQEVVSCILKHIKKLRSEKHIIAYSDMCTGQNRNIKVALMWLKIVQALTNNVEIIDHKFLISGHSFLPNDRDFAV
ncbi:uncharacterized protein, partial [Atheta coriaria]|uniref:uncharacterized protein n=1 Tax=Dalotia coriaria TaxID=877792 RepID=UPI0031F3D72E